LVQIQPPQPIFFNRGGLSRLRPSEPRGTTLHRCVRGCRAKSRTTQHRPITLDKGTRPLDNCVAKRRVIAFRSAKTGKPFETTKRRPRTVSSCRSAALVRLIIPPQRRDRWFKSSPRNQYSRRNAARAAFLLYQSIACPELIAKQTYSSYCKKKY